MQITDGSDTREIPVNSIVTTTGLDNKFASGIEIGKVVLSCTNQTGDAKEEIFVTTEGKNLEAGFNPKYFLDSLKAIDEEEISVELGSSISPCLVKSVENNEYVYMILPIRLKE